MDGMQALDALDLDEHQVLDKQIGAESLVESQAVEVDRYRNLARHAQPARLDPPGKRKLVDGLQ